jgi:hypothetical protein
LYFKYTRKEVISYKKKSPVSFPGQFSSFTEILYGYFLKIYLENGGSYASKKKKAGNQRRFLHLKDGLSMNGCAM